MRFYIVIPAHNEEAYLEQTLNSLVAQSHRPTKLIVVNDHSTDGTQKIIDQFSTEHSWISSLSLTSSEEHEPGSKVVRAFNSGAARLDGTYDILCKFDADLIFPFNYLECLTRHFEEDSKVGMVGGFCYIENKGRWVKEGLTNNDHIRGALKAYRKECFDAIGGLKESMGWDTVDELLAHYHGWKVKTDETLHVKHLKPTSASYSKASGVTQGNAFRKMRYGFCLSFIAASKLAVKKKSLPFLMNATLGYFKNGKNYIVTEQEGRYIRKYRWRNIKKKLFS